MAYWLWKVLRKLIANVHQNGFTVVENSPILDQFIPDCIHPDSGLNTTNFGDYTVFLIIILITIPSSRISQLSSHMQLCMHIYETRIPFSTGRLEGVIQRHWLSLLRIEPLPSIFYDILVRWNRHVFYVCIPSIITMAFGDLSWSSIQGLWGITQTKMKNVTGCGMTGNYSNRFKYTSCYMVSIIKHSNILLLVLVLVIPCWW